MLTPNQITSGSNIRIYESTTALNHTIADCRQCHIGNGPHGCSGALTPAQRALMVEELRK